MVSAPASDIGTGYLDRMLGNGLHARSYVDSIAVVQEVDSPEEPEPVSRDAFEAPDRGFVAELTGPSYAIDGIAFTEDANQSTLEESREIIDANETSADGTGVEIAVLDDGVTYDEDLYGDRFEAGKDFVGDRPATENNSWENVSSAGGHGDWVAGAMAANASNDSHSGVAENASLVVGKTLGVERRNFGRHRRRPAVGLR